MTKDVVMTKYIFGHYVVVRHVHS